MFASVRTKAVPDDWQHAGNADGTSVSDASDGCCGVNDGIDEIEPGRHYEVLGPAPPGERCWRCGKGSGVQRIKHGGEINLWHQDCADKYFGAMADPPVKAPELPPDPLDEHGAPPAAHASPVPSDARARPWPGLSPRAVDRLARQVSELKISSTAELKDAIRSRLAKSGVPAEPIDVEVEKVVCRIEALDDVADTVEPAPYEVLGPAPPGERCVCCGKGSGVKRIKRGGEVDLLHEGCARDLSAATANPPVKLPDLGPDALDEHGAQRAASLPFALTQDMKRRLRAHGYSDEQIAHLAPHQAHEILAQEGRQPNA
jgi:hypothetical protein